MTDLGIKVREVPEKLTESGIFVIKKVNVNIQTRIGLAHELILSNGKIERSLYIKHYDQPSSRSNLGRLVKAFSSDSERWIEKKIETSFDKEDKCRIATVGK